MNSFIKGICTSFSIVFISELGDKTFFIIAGMCQKNSVSAILLGNQLAMTPLIILSAYVGKAATLLPRIYLDLVSFLSFFVLALWAYKESYHEYKKNKRKLNKPKNIPTDLSIDITKKKISDSNFNHPKKKLSDSELDESNRNLAGLVSNEPKNKLSNPEVDESNNKLDDSILDEFKKELTDSNESKKKSTDSESDDFTKKANDLDSNETASGK